MYTTALSLRETGEWGAIPEPHALRDSRVRWREKRGLDISFSSLAQYIKKKEWQQLGCRRGGLVCGEGWQVGKHDMWGSMRCG